MIIYHLDDTILPFDQRGTAFHPITAIVIRDSAELPNRCAVDVAAQNRIDRELLRVMDDLLFESTDETDRVLNPLFGVGANAAFAFIKPCGLLPASLCEQAEKSRIVEPANEKTKF